MEKSTVILEHDAAEHAAFLTLTRGVSTWGSWAFDASDIGTSISIGANPGCDWQIASPGVAPLTLLFTGDGLLVRARRSDARVTLNGAPLHERWVPLQNGDLLQLGNSSIAVSLPPRAQSGATRSRGGRARKAARREKSGGSRRKLPLSGRAFKKPGTAAVLVRAMDATPGAPVLFDPPATGRSQNFWRYAAIAVATAGAYLGWLALLDYL